MSFVMRSIGPADQRIIGMMAMELVASIRNVSNMIQRGDARAEAEMWFGDTSDVWMKRVSTALTRMASIINLEDIDVSFRALSHRKGSFAAARPPQAAGARTPR